MDDVPKRVIHLCKCGLSFESHRIFYAGMITDRAISIHSSSSNNNNATIASSSKPLNSLIVCGHPDIQLRCHNREPGYPSVENTLSHGAPSWRWQILAAPFLDHRACTLIQACGSENRTPIRRLLRFILLVKEYNKTQLQPGENPLKIYLVGDIKPKDIDSNYSDPDPDSIVTS